MKRCVGEIPEVGNANTSFTDNAFNMTVDYECHIGHEYPDKEVVKSIICLETSQWSPAPPDCQSESCSMVICL